MMMETINNMLVEMYATFAHAEMQKREKRQREGIASMKERGEWQDHNYQSQFGCSARITKCSQHRGVRKRYERRRYFKGVRGSSGGNVE